MEHLPDGCFAIGLLQILPQAAPDSMNLSRYHLVQPRPKWASTPARFRFLHGALLELPLPPDRKTVESLNLFLQFLIAHSSGSFNPPSRNMNFHSERSEIIRRLPMAIALP